MSLRSCVIQTDYICQNLRFVYKIGLCCRKSLKIGVERQRQDNVQTGDKVQVKQTLIPPEKVLLPHPEKKNTNTNSAAPGDRHCELSHFYINLTFCILVNIHFQMDQK